MKLKAIADEILSGGGAIETATLDALDEQAVEEHMAELIRKSGKSELMSAAVFVASDEGAAISGTIYS